MFFLLLLLLLSLPRRLHLHLPTIVALTILGAESKISSINVKFLYLKMSVLVKNLEFVLTISESTPLAFRLKIS
ncbi:hypothetical protein F4821DRAFT_240920 [Hypoxylon rubiginosum]|uniref:Uncharacterized protein n=1 Tax=Hypoxylon rubiginosum TaxID=110542 RepID=A0ACC0CYG9_9PEZI|nr:hypothetical protein F4821DRAFT_240920 [Hypoxylon rubiginosum]